MFGMLTRSAARAFSTKDLRVFHDVAKQQFCVGDCGKPSAVLTYRCCGRYMTLVHTCVPVCYQGRGIGSHLSQHALNYAKKNNLELIIQCHFIADYYMKNKDKYLGMKVQFQLTNCP